MSGTVTSQANGLPLAQGIKVAPSGRLPSCMSPTGMQEFQLVLLPSRLDHSFDCGADASVHSFDTLDRVGHGHRQLSHIGMCVARMLGIPVFERLTL